MKFKNGTNVFKFDFEAPLAFPHRPLGMSLEEMFKAIVDGDRDDKPAQTTTTKTTTTTTRRKRQRDVEEDSDGHDADDEKEATGKQSARGGEREVAGTKRRKLPV